MAATQDEVEVFLRDFKIKMKVFQIYFLDNRNKNTQALLSLELTPDKRKEILLELEVFDFSSGPIDDDLYGSKSLWIFCATLKDKQIYIKISMGRVNESVLCISFHEAEFPMDLPFKK